MAPGLPLGSARLLALVATALLLVPSSLAAESPFPPGCKPPELIISREHPLVILYGLGDAARAVKCWGNLQADIRPYCVLTMDPPSLDIPERLAGWRRMLAVMQQHQVPIALQVAGDEANWTTPLWVIETLLKEFPCVKIVQVVEMRCAFYSEFAGELELAVPPNLRYLGELLKLCGRYGKHLSLQIQADMVHLASDALAGPLREIFRAYRAYFLPQNECIPATFYPTHAATCGLWLAGYCDHWGIEPQWWWWTKGESYFIRPGLFGVEAELETAEDTYARLYRAFIIEGALLGATVFSIEPPQDIWDGERTDQRHWDNVIYPTLRQIIEQRLIPTQDEVLARAKAAYQLKECRNVREFDTQLQDLDLEVAQGNLERAAYGALMPHLMKEMIPDTGGRYFFIPLLPVGSPPSLAARFSKVITPGECATPQAYRELLDRYYPPTENARDAAATNRACVMRCGRAVAVLQSRENLYERQPFAVELPRWVTGLRGQAGAGGVRLNWDHDADTRSYSVWKRIPGANVYPQWGRVRDGLTEPGCVVPAAEGAAFGVTAVTPAVRVLEGTVNYTDYLLFTTEESPIVEYAVVRKAGVEIAPVKWTDDSLPARQEVWRIMDGVRPGDGPAAEAVLERFGGLIAAFEGKDVEQLMSFYDPDYRDSNGYGLEYVRRAWLWWGQRTVVPYVVAQIRRWDTSRAAEGAIQFTAWNRFRGTMIWDEPFGFHGRVRIPRHEGERVTWTWKRDARGQWNLAGTTPALPNFGEMLWNSRGHDRPHEMRDFADTPASRGGSARTGPSR
jgi:hypothetical protein